MIKHFNNTNGIKADSTQLETDLALFTVHAELLWAEDRIGIHLSREAQM
jgi:hypothetical protein